MIRTIIAVGFIGLPLFMAAPALADPGDISCAPCVITDDEGLPLWEETLDNVGQAPGFIINNWSKMPQRAVDGWSNMPQRAIDGWSNMPQRAVDGWGGMPGRIAANLNPNTGGDGE